LKKIASYQELESGKIYNRIYVGDNEAYAKINGKETFVVIATSPELVTRVLFDQFGSPFSEELTSNETIFGNPGRAFADFELYEAENRSDWFIKSQYMKLDQAIKENLVTIDEVRQGIVSSPPQSLERKSFYCRYPVEGRSKNNPYLQAVLIKWDSREEMKKDFAEFGIEIS